MPEKTVCMVSGGIDSPVAAAIVGQEKEIIPLHFVLYPYYCEETFSLSMRALRRLRKVVKFDQIALFPWGSVLQKIFTGLRKREMVEYSCVLCRKSMFKAASLVCDKVGASSITTGEAIGQKASQTLDNLEATSFGVEYPIIRPLSGMDKEEIIQRSRDLGLFMPKHAGCCNATPDEPRTEADPEEMEELFKDLSLQEVIDDSFEDCRIVNLKERELYDVFYSYLKDMLGADVNQKS